MKIFRYLKPYWYLVLLAPLTMIGEVLMDLFQPKLMSQIVDVGLGEGKNNVILSAGLLMLAFTALEKMYDKIGTKLLNNRNPKITRRHRK